MISIICFGNTLFADDGAGEAVFKQLQLELKNKPEWQEDVQAIYAGNSGQRVFPYFISSSYLIVVDAIQSQQAGSSHPGQIVCLSENELSQLEDDKFEQNFSSHHLSLPQSWQLLKTCRNDLPRFTLFAIEIASAMPFSIGLSTEVESATNQVVERILQLCQRQLVH